MNIRGFLAQRCGPSALDRVCAATSRETASTLREARWSSWYPARAQTEALATMDRLFGRGDGALIPEIGAYQCMRDLETPLGWVFRLFPPGRLLKHMDVVWRRFHDTGVWNAGEDAAGSWAELYDWDGGSLESCAVVAGYLRRVTSELAGDELVLEHPRCAFRSASRCVYRVNRRFTPLAPLGLTELEPADLALVGRELAQLPTLDSTAEAIVLLLQRQVPGCDALLWLADEKRPGELRLLHRLGRPRDRYEHAWSLESRGLSIGRLELHTELDDDDRRLRTLADLVPWFGLALGAALPGDAPKSPSWEALLSLADGRWNLTPRQREVLGLVVRGRSNRQISMELGCAESTVELHVSTLLKKASVAGRSELIASLLEQAQR